MKKAAKGSEKVYLATDPDREGEAISWHLKELLDLPDDKACRVTFTRSPSGWSASPSPPPGLSTWTWWTPAGRRILDRIVGYELSPLL